MNIYRHRYRICLYFILGVLLSAECLAQQHNQFAMLQWQEETKSIGTIGRYGIGMFIDESMEKTFQDIRSTPDLLQLTNNPVPSASYGPKNLWVNFNFKNNTAGGKEFFLNAEYGFYDEIEFFIVRSDGQVESTLMGDIFPFAHRPVDVWTFALPFEVASRETVSIYVRATSEELTLLRMTMHDATSLNDYIMETYVVISGLTCAIAIMLLYNLGIFISIRDKRYLYFILYGGANYLTLYTYGGFAYSTFWPDSPAWHASCLQMFGAIQSATLLLFTRSYIDLPKHARSFTVSRVLEGLCWASILTIPFVPQGISLQIASVISTFAHAISLFIGIHSCILRIRHAYFFIAAFGCMLMGMVANMFLVLSPQFADSVMSYAIEYGPVFTSIAFALQLAILSLGLGDRFNQVQKLNEAMTLANLERSSRAREELQNEVQRQTLKLREQNTKLQDLDHQKTQFFQNISHELRTPLTLILNPLEAVSEKYTDEPSLKMATRNAQRLLRLVNQLLDFQKLGAGQKKIDLNPVNVLRFTHICADYFSSACDSKRIKFKVTVDAEPMTEEESKNSRIFIEGEVDALEKIIFNLLSNAIKFTPDQGTIELGVILQEKSARLFVKDTGPGISKDDQSRLFQTFAQVDGTTTRDYEGTGIGLAYVKGLTLAMDGKVGLDSTPGEGSCFWVEFNRCADPGVIDTGTFKVKDWLLAGMPAKQDESLAKPDHNAVGKGEKILIVDDLEDMRRLISGTLRKDNYELITANNGLVGWEKARDMKPDLIISDWMMPELSGPELIAKIKADPNLSSTPVILLTAKSDTDSKLQGTQIGADAFLGKPFNTQELLSVVHNLLTLKEKEKEVAKLNRHITENVLKRYLPPNLIEDILDGKIKMEDSAQTMMVTLLFSDLSGFTAMSEKLGAEQMASLLNQYLTVMNEVIFDHGGTIDKFMGDGIMVIFGAPHQMQKAEQAIQAVSCGKAMQRALDELCIMWQARGIPKVTMRVGVHQGMAVVGNFGSNQRSDYTAIGPTVNLASRIETSCAQQKVYISSEVAQHLGEGECIEVGDFKMKGIEEPMKLYMVIDNT